MRHAARGHTKLEARGRQVLNRVETSAEHFLSVLEKQARRRFDTLLRNLDFASLHEVHNLSRRVARLERQLRSEQPVDRESAPLQERTPLVGHRAGVQMTNLRRYAELGWDEV